MIKQHWLLLTILAALVYGANIGGTSIYILDEARNASCAMEMQQRNDWIVPTFNGVLRTDKPPLHYYAMRLAYTLWGIQPFAARFFSVAMGVLMVLTVYFFGRKLFSEMAAFIASLILIASLQLAIQFHLAVPDPYLLFLLTLGWLSFIYAYSKTDIRFYYVFYVAVSLATLAKGPVAVVFSGLVVLIFLLVQRQLTFKKLLAIKIPIGILIFCAIVVPWYVAVGMATQGEWLEQFFLKHNVGRFTATMEGHKGFPFASGVIVIGALLPFSFFIPQAIHCIWKVRRSNAVVQFVAIAFLVVVIFFAFSRTILPSYPEPAVPFFALLLGYFFDYIFLNPHRVTRMKLWINALVFFVLMAALPLVVQVALQKEPSLAHLANRVYPYFFILSVGGAVGFYLILKQRIDRALYVYAAASIVFLVSFFYLIFPQIDKQNPVQKGLPVLTESIPVVAYRDFNPAFVFALQSRIPVLVSTDDSNMFAKKTKAFYILTQTRHLKDLEQLPTTILFQGKDLFENRTTVILKVDQP